MKTWITQGIATRQNLVGLDLTPEFRQWLSDNVGPGPQNWHWDWFWEEDETMITFIRSEHAMLFKLTWL